MKVPSIFWAVDRMNSLLCPVVASQIVRMSKCAVPVGNERMVVKPKKVALKPAVKFEVLLRSYKLVKFKLVGLN